MFTFHLKSDGMLLKEKVNKTPKIVLILSKLSCRFYNLVCEILGPMRKSLKKSEQQSKLIAWEAQTSVCIAMHCTMGKLGHLHVEAITK